MTAAAKPQNAVARQPDRRTAVQVFDRDALRDELGKFAPSFAKVLPKHLTPERMVTLTLVAATKTPKLFECTLESLALSVMKVSQWGLEIGETAHLVPFFDKKQGKLVCVPIADWKGKIQMLLNARHVRKIVPRARYANEPFVVEYGANERLEHHPIFEEKDRGPLTHVYAVATLRGGDITFDVMGRAEVERIRNAAPSKDSDAWKGHFDEMAKKTVIHRISKRLPKSPELREALANEDALDSGDDLPIGNEVTARTPIREPDAQRASLPVSTYSGYDAEPQAERDETGRPTPRETTVQPITDERIAPSATADEPRAPAESTAASEPETDSSDADVDVVTQHALSASGQWAVPAGDLRGKLLGHLDNGRLIALRDSFTDNAAFAKRYAGTVNAIQELLEERREFSE